MSGRRASLPGFVSTVDSGHAAPRHARCWFCWVIVGGCSRLGHQCDATSIWCCLRLTVALSFRANTEGFYFFVASSLKKLEADSLGSLGSPWFLGPAAVTTGYSASLSNRFALRRPCTGEAKCLSWSRLTCGQVQPGRKGQVKAGRGPAVAPTVPQARGPCPDHGDPNPRGSGPQELIH